MQSCSESTLDMILISQSMLSLLSLFVIKDFSCRHNLKKQGLRVHALNSVYNAIALNKTLYALSVCFSYLTEGHKDTLRRVLKRANRMGFTFHGYDFDQLNETSQDKLFRYCRSERHCLHHLFTVESSPPAAMHLRQRGQDFMLPNIKYDFNKRHVHFFIMSKFYVFVLCVRVCTVSTVFHR